jgi:hypothetical protein
VFARPGEDPIVGWRPVWSPWDLSNTLAPTTLTLYVRRSWATRVRNWLEDLQTLGSVHRSGVQYVIDDVADQRPAGSATWVRYTQVR